MHFQSGFSTHHVAWRRCNDMWYVWRTVADQDNSTMISLHTVHHWVSSNRDQKIHFKYWWCYIDINQFTHRTMSRGSFLRNTSSSVLFANQHANWPDCYTNIPAAYGWSCHLDGTMSTFEYWKETHNMPEVGKETNVLHFTEERWIETDEMLSAIATLVICRFLSDGELGRFVWVWIIHLHLERNSAYTALHVADEKVKMRWSIYQAYSIDYIEWNGVIGEEEIAGAARKTYQWWWWTMLHSSFGTTCRKQTHHEVCYSHYAKSSNSNSEWQEISDQY